MASQDDDRNDFDDSRAPKEPREAGEFTRAFGGKDKPKAGYPSSADSSPSQPGSLTQVLGGKSKPAPPAADSSPQLPSSAAYPPVEPTADSFTTAFEGVNAFTRSPGGVPEDPFKTEIGKQARRDSPLPPAPGSFTRLFGTGDGVLTPSGLEEDRDRKPVTPKASDAGETSFLRHPSPPPPAAGSFTEAFRSQPPPQAPESRPKGGSFTEQFQSPSSWPAPEAPLPSSPPRTYPPTTADPFRARQEEPPPLGSPQRPETSEGGFTRLVSSYGADATPLPDATRPSIPAPRTPPGTAASPDATITFKPRPAEPEVAGPQGKSEYTMVMEASKFRASSDRLAAGPPAATASASPPTPIQYPPAPQPPAWPPAPAMPAPPAWGQPPAPPAWGQPPMAPMPQPPATPQLAMPPKLPGAGERLVQFLPLILTLSVVNTLGLLAVLIILFATRR